MESGMSGVRDKAARLLTTLKDNVRDGLSRMTETIMQKSRLSSPGARDLIKDKGKAIYTGFLRKRSSQPIQKNYKWKYFFTVLADGYLYYYKDEFSDHPTGMFSLLGYKEVRKATGGSDKLQAAGDDTGGDGADRGRGSVVVAHTFLIEPAFDGVLKTYYFAAQSSDEMQVWMQKIKASIKLANEEYMKCSTLPAQSKMMLRTAPTKEELESPHQRALPLSQTPTCDIEDTEGNYSDPEDYLEIQDDYLQPVHASNSHSIRPEGAASLASVRAGDVDGSGNSLNDVYELPIESLHQNRNSRDSLALTQSPRASPRVPCRPLLQHPPHPATSAGGGSKGAVPNKSKGESLAPPPVQDRFWTLPRNSSATPTTDSPVVQLSPLPKDCQSTTIASAANSNIPCSQRSPASEEVRGISLSVCAVIGGGVSPLSAGARPLPAGAISVMLPLGGDKRAYPPRSPKPAVKSTLQDAQPSDDDKSVVARQSFDEVNIPATRRTLPQPPSKQHLTALETTRSVQCDIKDNSTSETKPLPKSKPAQVTPNQTHSGGISSPSPSSKLEFYWIGSKEAAICALNERKSEDGVFLVRDSENDSISKVLCVTAAGKVHSLKLYQHTLSDGQKKWNFDLMDNSGFSSVEALIAYHQKEPIVIRQGSASLQLGQPYSVRSL